MTPEQQRIAIAQACGWWISESLSIWQHKTKDGAPPDYLNDLNAMQQMEKAMNNNDWWKFVEHLTNICGGGIALGISATAPQRAEAFLRTIGKWEEAK